MNWIAHLDTMTTIVVSADAASFCISAVFFSERIRRWAYRKRWGSHPAAASLLYAVALAGMDDLSSGAIRPQPIATLRNPFDPRTRAALVNETALQAHRANSDRPTFRRSTVLQQRIADYERTLAALLLSAPQARAAARPAPSPISGGLLNPRFENFSIGQLQEAQLS